MMPSGHSAFFSQQSENRARKRICRRLWCLSTKDKQSHMSRNAIDLQSQKAVTAYLKSKQLQPFGFARHNGRYCMTHLRWRMPGIKVRSPYRRSKSGCGIWDAPLSTRGTSLIIMIIPWVKNHGISVLPANTSRLSNVGLILGQRRRRWPNINSTLDKRLLFAGSCRFYVRGEKHHSVCCFSSKTLFGHIYDYADI